MSGDRFLSWRALKVWREAMSLAAACYELTRAFPKEEMYGMTSRICRAAASVAANMAEGRGRETTASFVRFPRTAQGSLKELETHLTPWARVKTTQVDRVEPLLRQCDEIGRTPRAATRAPQQRIEREAKA